MQLFKHGTVHYCSMSTLALGGPCPLCRFTQPNPFHHPHWQPALQPVLPVSLVARSGLLTSMPVPVSIGVAHCTNTLQTFRKFISCFGLEDIITRTGKTKSYALKQFLSPKQVTLFRGILSKQKALLV